MSLQEESIKAKFFLLMIDNRHISKLPDNVLKELSDFLLKYGFTYTEIVKETFETGSTLTTKTISILKDIRDCKITLSEDLPIQVNKTNRLDSIE